jgi:hypothetical protein
VTVKIDGVVKANVDFGASYSYNSGPVAPANFSHT